jgi:hypothetical protein
MWVRCCPGTTPAEDLGSDPTRAPGQAPPNQRAQELPPERLGLSRLAQHVSVLVSQDLADQLGHPSRAFDHHKTRRYWYARTLPHRPATP